MRRDYFVDPSRQFDWSVVNDNAKPKRTASTLAIVYVPVRNCGVAPDLIGASDRLTDSLLMPLEFIVPGENVCPTFLRQHN